MKAVIIDFKETLYSGGKLYPDTITFLKKAKKEFLMCLLTSGTSKQTLELMDSFEIPQLYE